MVALAVIAILWAAGCTAQDPPPPLADPQVRTPTEAVTVLAVDDPVALAVAASAALFTSSPIVALAGADDRPAQVDAAASGFPLLLTPAGADDPAGVTTELDRLGAAVLPFGDAATEWAQGRRVADDPTLTPPGPSDVLVLTTDTASPAAATARAAGARVEAVTDPDPRVAAPPGLDPRPAHVLALGSAFGDADTLAARLDVAAGGQLLPGGGQVLFPGRRMVALYGHPGVPALGVLGEQDIPASIARAKELAADYQTVSDQPVVPAFELISTIADSGPGPDGDYSSEATVEFLRPWVDAARDAGVYVLLDLQPGRTDFLTQAQSYTELLAQPHVGLALDPEWRLGPDERPLRQIGTVGVDEVNSVVTWLADLTAGNALPQKLLMVHQFRLPMIRERALLDTSRDELAVVLHADGFGTPEDKLGTWTSLHEAEPAGVTWGWKNFYDEDTPMFTPAQTLALRPVPPVFVSFQ